MTVRAICRRERATRLLGWALVAAVFGFLLWIVFGGRAARAEDPKAAARVIGQCGHGGGGRDRARLVQCGERAGLCGH